MRWEIHLGNARLLRAGGDDYGALESFKLALDSADRLNDANGRLQILKEMQRYYVFLSLSDDEATKLGLPTAAQLSARIES